MTKFNFRLINSSVDSDVVFFEDLKTKSLTDDSINIMKEETAFTKEGFYLIALHWTEELSTASDKETLSEMLDDGRI